MTKTILAAMALACCITTSAHNITGTVVDSTNSMAHEGATVNLMSDSVKEDTVAAIKSKQLQEVVVTANSLRTFANKDILILSQQAMKTGNNALDAISSLPQFTPSFDNNSLQSIDGKQVLVLINGIKRSARDLVTLKANEIKKITYYSEPPARYAHLGVGAVIDVEVKKPVDRLYSLYVDTKNSFTTGYGTNTLFASYRDSLNNLSAAYFIDYRDMHKQLMNNSYHYDNTTNEYRGTSGSYSGQYHIAQLSYQREQGSDLFYSLLSYTASPGYQNFTQRHIANGIDGAENNRRLHSDFSSYKADLYYKHSFSRQNTLEANVVNTWYTSNSNNRLFGGTNDYSFQNIAHNKTYSIISELTYSNRLWGGNVVAGAYYMYKDFNQTYNDSIRSFLNYQQIYGYADYSNSISALSYNLGVGLENDRYRLADGKVHNFLVFRPKLTLSYKFSRTSSLRLWSGIYTNVPGMGSLTDSRVAIDQHYFAQGNPGLQPARYYYNQLQFQLSSQNGKWYVGTTVQHSYFPNANVSVIALEGSDVVNRDVPIGNSNQLGASLVLSIRPWPWLMVQPNYYYSYSNYDTPNKNISHSQHIFATTLMVTTGAWQFLANYRMPTTRVSGEFFTHSGSQIVGSVLYKHKAMSIGLEYQWSEFERTYANVPHFSMTEQTHWTRMKNLCLVKFTYYFQQGKARSQSTKELQNADSDSGLTRSNTAKQN